MKKSHVYVIGYKKCYKSSESCTLEISYKQK